MNNVFKLMYDLAKSEKLGHIYVLGFYTRDYACDKLSCPSEEYLASDWCKNIFINKADSYEDFIQKYNPNDFCKIDIFVDVDGEEILLSFSEKDVVNMFCGIKYGKTINNYGLGIVFDFFKSCSKRIYYFSYNHYESFRNVDFEIKNTFNYNLNNFCIDNVLKNIKELREELKGI